MVLYPGFYSLTTPFARNVSQPTYLFVQFRNPLSKFASVLQKTRALPSVREEEGLQDSVADAWPNTASLTSRLLISSYCRIGGLLE